MEEIREKLRTFIAESFLFGRRDANLSDDDSLIENGIIDSTGVLMLVAFLEKDLGVHVQDDEIVPENLDSLNRLAAFAARKLGQGKEPAASPVTDFVMASSVMQGEVHAA